MLQLITLSMEVIESSSSSSLSTSDRIHQLPGQPQVSYQQFSGYVTVDAKKQKALVLEAESNPASKPLVIWLNGEYLAALQASYSNLPDSTFKMDELVHKAKLYRKN